MAYPDWKDFEYIFKGNFNKPFEALARNLFKKRYGIGDTLSYFKNHPGNETDTIQIGSDVVGFQAKYFDDTINAKDITDSIEAARKRNPDQTLMLIYTNKEFGIPKYDKTTGKPKDKTEKQKNVEAVAQKHNLKLEWILGDNILDEVIKDDLLMKVFFDAQSHLRMLQHDMDGINAIRTSRIQTGIILNDQELKIDRGETRKNFREKLKNYHIIVSGNGGAGKSAVVKDYLTGKETDVIYLWMDAHQFATNDVSSLFRFGNSYTLLDIVQFYENDKDKLLIIDSAEELIDQPENDALYMTLQTLEESGWRIVFTSREYAENDLKGLAEDALKGKTEVVKVNSLTRDELNQFLEDNQIPIPPNPNLVDRIRTLFFLARYVEVANSGTELKRLRDFRDKVWDVKIKGGPRTTGAQKKDRENCFVSVVKEQADHYGALIETNNLDSNAFIGLVKDEVLTDEGSMLCRVAHDIYRDWGLEIIIDQEYKKKGNLLEFARTNTGNHYMVNAFGQWLETQIDAGEQGITDIITGSLAGDYPSRWEDKVMAVALSPRYADGFFRQYDQLLLTDNYSGLTKVLRTLILTGQLVRYVQYEGKDVALKIPYGGAWDKAVALLYEHKENYLKSYQGIVLDFLTAYASHQYSSEESKRKAGLTVLYMFDLDEAPRQKGDYFLLDRRGDWSTLVCMFAEYIKDELIAIIDKTVAGEYGEDDDIPYDEMLTYLINTEHYYLQPRLAKAIPEGLFKLMDFFWLRRDDAQDARANRPYREPEYYCGIAEHQGPGNAFFPPSGLWGSTGALMLYHPEETVDFVIQLMNRCVDNLRQRSRDPYLVAETILMVDGTENHVYYSQSLWDLYRGTGNYSMPHLLECVHMAMENALLAIWKDKKSDEQPRQLLWEIMRKSHSASLMAIVASIVCAYPDDLFEEALVLFGNYEFLILDDLRKQRERNALSIEFMYHRHLDMFKERDASKKKPHRVLSLSDLCIQYQIAFKEHPSKENEQKFNRIRVVVDSLQNKAKKTISDFGISADDMLMHVDYFKHKREEVKVGGVDAVQMTPILNEKQLQREEQRKKGLDNFMRGIYLKNWVDSRHKRTYDQSGAMAYDKNPSKAFEEARELEKLQEEKPEDFFLMPGDEFVPNAVYATLIRDFGSSLDSEQYEYCKNIVVNSLKQAGVMVSNSLSELGVSLEALPFIIKEDADKLAYIDLIIVYLESNYKYINERCSTLISKSFHQAHMWEDEPVYMKSVLEAFILKKTEGLGLNELPDEIADNVITFLPEGTKDPELRETARVCIEKASHLWERRNKYHHVASHEEMHDIAQHIADYVIKSSPEECMSLLQPFLKYVNDDNGIYTLLDGLLIESVVRQEYTNFWQIWEMFYGHLIKKEIASYHSDSLSTYLLNPMWVNDKYGEWFKLNEHYFSFFRRVCGEIASCPIVIYVLSRHWYVMGRKFDFEYLGMIGEIVQKYPDMDLKDYEGACVTYLEQFVKELSKKTYQIKQTEERKRQADALLTFLEKRNSTVAAQLRQQIL